MMRSLIFYFTLTLLISCSHQPKKVIDFESGKGFSHVDIEGEYFLEGPAYRGNKTIVNFYQAKKIIKQNNYFGIKEELYCGCQFQNSKIPLDANCGIKPRKNEERAYRIEFEHIVPFENQVGHTKAWTEGAPVCGDKKRRKCSSIAFAHMEADLWNLWPAAGELNADRSNFSYSMIRGPRDQYGKCDFKVQDRKVEPRDSVKALIAYTYKYFQKSYARYLKTEYISDKNQKLFEAWAKYPLTHEQCEWARSVEKVQGNRNEDLLAACEGK